MTEQQTQQMIKDINELTPENKKLLIDYVTKLTEQAKEKEKRT